MDESEWIGIRNLGCLVEMRKRVRGKKNGEEEELERTRSGVAVVVRRTS